MRPRDLGYAACAFALVVLVGHHFFVAADLDARRALAANRWDLEGIPERIIDGDTLVLNGARLRLRDMDAPELVTRDGPAAREHLKQLVGASPVRCILTGARSYERHVAECYGRHDRELSAAMIADGWATALWSHGGSRYAVAEWRARAAGRGMHGG